MQKNFSGLSGLGYIDTCVNEKLESAIIELLKDPVTNIYIAGMHLSDLRNIDFKGLNAESFEDAHIQIIATRYNVGPDASLEYITSHLSYGVTIINNRKFIEEALYGA